MLSVELFTRGSGSEIHFAGYNQYSQEILNEASEMYRFGPSIVILAARTEELFPDFHRVFYNLSSRQLGDEKQRIIDLFKSLIQSLKEKCDATILINNFTQPQSLAAGIHDTQDLSGQIEWLRKLNSALVALSNIYSDTYIFDLDRSMQEFGLNNSSDPKMWYTASIPYNKLFIRHIAINYAQYINSTHGRKKCLVLDLDNTLWGGIIGEDGINNIVLGKTYPGNIFVDIQCIVKQYAQQGVILAINSKNNEDDVEEVFENHPDMVLKWDDFAATRINWNSKPQNFVDLADEINIGLDSMVFVDDNPFETQMVKESFPEIEIVQFGEDPLENLMILKSLEYFNILGLTSEDLKKFEHYKTQAKRNRFKSSLDNMEDFYRGLKMKVEIQKCDEFALRRVAQLTQKTNQFNLTTKQYTDGDIERFMKSKNNNVYYLSMKDKFGDSGITGVIITKEVVENWYIDTFLLSCRIIGRTVENAFLSFLVNRAREKSVKRIIGEYIPTTKNILVKNFYEKNGFLQADDGLWVFNTSLKIPFPDWIELN